MGFVSWDALLCPHRQGDELFRLLKEEPGVLARRALACRGIALLAHLAPAGAIR